MRKYKFKVGDIVQVVVHETNDYQTIPHIGKIGVVKDQSFAPDVLFDDKTIFVFDQEELELYKYEINTIVKNLEKLEEKLK